MGVYERFLGWLPVRRLPPRGDGQPLGAEAVAHIRRVERILVAAAAGLAVLGCLGYYLPVYAAWAALVVIVFPPLFGFR